MTSITALGGLHGRATRTLIASFAIMVAQSAQAADAISDTESHELVIKVVLALGTLLIAQAIIPICKAWFEKRALRRTYRSYLRAHVSQTLEHFDGAGSAQFANKLVSDPDSEWLKFLKANSLGVPAIFLALDGVIKKALTDSVYIPAVSYLGFENNVLDHTSPIWQIDGKEAAVALQYFLTQQQIITAIDYQYGGWFFELIKSGDTNARKRWCLSLQSVLLDMAQHYKAARELKDVLESK